MSSILKVDTIQDQSGNNIINENADTITIGASGDTITIPSGATIDTSVATLTLPTTIEVDTIEPQSGTSLTLGASGDTVSVPTGATLDVTNATVTGLPASGKVLQVITATDATERATTSASYVTGSNTLSVSITPSSASNKILILVTSSAWLTNSGYGGYYTIFRDATNLAGANGMTYMVQEPNSSPTCSLAMSYLDSPSTTSATTYQVYMKVGGGNSIRLNMDSTTGSITAFEIAG
jgi:hypothetical protein